MSIEGLDCKVRETDYIEYNHRGYRSSSSKITPEIEQRMVYSYRENPHISLKDLRYVKITHYDFDGMIQTGELVVHKCVAVELMLIFKEVFEAKFPIKQMVLVDNFGYEGVRASELDDLSMAADNSSAFFYRTVTGDPTRVSEHGLGLAVDINTIENPYVNGEKIFPPAGRAHLDRTLATKGLITKDSAIYKAFEKYGWEWGGNWPDLQDYQHFQKRPRDDLIEAQVKKQVANG